MTTQQSLYERICALRLYGLMARFEEYSSSPWLEELIRTEEEVRAERSLERRVREAHLGRFKPLADFDWDWPAEIDKVQIEELLELPFIERKSNVILFGPNGVGKTMIAKNMAHMAVMRGYKVRFCVAGTLLAELSEQETLRSLNNRLKRYSKPDVLVIDEVGYLSYDDRAADLLFEVVNRRYEEKSTILTTNKPFSEWKDVFPNATCVVTLVDRLIHHAELISIKGESFRLKEAREENNERASRRRQQAKNKASKK